MCHMADIFVVLLMSTIASFLRYTGYLKSLVIAHSSSASLLLKTMLQNIVKRFLRGMVKNYLGLLNISVEFHHQLKA